jgi:hypothetical protein
MSAQACGVRRGWKDKRALALAMAAWVAATLACAVSVPPSGGPEDKSPPDIASTVPRADSTGVDPRTEIRVAFSESMRRERVERDVIVNPPIEIERIRWEGNTLVIQPAHELVRDTTYVVRIKPEYQDQHGVPGARWHEFAFATGTAALDTARIDGKMTFKHAPALRAMARAFRVTDKDTVRVEKDRPDREATADRDGKFSLRHLPSNGGRFIVMGFLDQNNNGIYDSDGDPALVYPDTVVLASGNPTKSGVDLDLLDPKEPGEVKGTVVNESGAAGVVVVAMYDEADTTRAAYHAVCDSTGAYEVKKVKPSTYVLRAFVDVKADSLPGVYPCATNPKGCAEPSARRPGRLRVKAGATVTEAPLAIRKEDAP